MQSKELLVERLHPDDVPAVRELLIEGLTQRWGTYSPELNPDIESFPTSFANAVTLVAKSGRNVVATGTLNPLSTEKAEIVRMSVAARNQRKGVGSAILVALLQRARELGVTEVVLETTTAWDSAVSFYTRHGFVATHRQGEDTYFRLAISGA